MLRMMFNRRPIARVLVNVCRQIHIGVLRGRSIKRSALARIKMHAYPSLILIHRRFYFVSVPCNEIHVFILPSSVIIIKTRLVVMMKWLIRGYSTAMLIGGACVLSS